MKKFTLLFAALLITMSAFAANITGGTKLYLKPGSAWTQGNERFAAYFFGSAGNAWVSMTLEEDESTYLAEAPNGTWTNVIFCRMNGANATNDWGAKWDQTTDLTYDGTNNCYSITSSSGSGFWSVYSPDAPKTYKDITITIVANAQPKIHYWEGGDKMVGSDWETKPDMVATGVVNTYSYTIKDVDESTGVNYLLVVGDIQSADLHTTTDVTADFKDLLPSVVVKGIDGDWSDKNKMTISDDYKTATITLNLAAKTYEWKLTVNGAWFGGSKYVITRDKNSIAVTDNGDGNGKLTADFAGDYVFTYTYATKNLTVTYPTYTVTVTAENGTVSGAGEYAPNAEATLEATPADGYYFVKWSDENTENPRSITVTSDVTLSAVFEAIPTPVAPELSLASGMFVDAFSVEIEKLEGLTYYYTINGGEETEYTTSINIEETSELVVWAVDRNVKGETTTVTYTKVARPGAPEFSYESGYFVEDNMPLEITAAANAPILVTIDGSEPTYEAVQTGKTIPYQGGMPVMNATIKARAYMTENVEDELGMMSMVFVKDIAGNYICSEVVTRTYTKVERPAAPEFSVESGEFEDEFNLEVWSAEDEDRDVYVLYTTDNTDPNAGAILGEEGTTMLYQYGVIVSQTTTVKAIVVLYDDDTDVAMDVHGNYIVSDIATATYTKKEIVTTLENAILTNVFVENGMIVADGEFQIFTITGQNVTDMNGSLASGAYIVRTATGVAKVMIK